MISDRSNDHSIREYKVYSSLDKKGKGGRKEKEEKDKQEESARKRKIVDSSAIEAQKILRRVQGEEENVERVGDDDCWVSLVGEYRGHSAEVRNLLYDTCHRILLSASIDHLIICWSVETRDVLWKIDLREAIHSEFPEEISAYGMVLSGNKLCAGVTSGKSNYMIVWELNSNVAAPPRHLHTISLGYLQRIFSMEATEENVFISASQRFLQVSYKEEGEEIRVKEAGGCVIS